MVVVHLPPSRGDLDLPPGSSALWNPSPKRVPALGTSAGRGLGQTLYTRSPIVGFRVSPCRRYGGQHTFFQGWSRTFRTPCHRARPRPHCGAAMSAPSGANTTTPPCFWGWWCQRDDWLGSENPRTASVYGFWRIAHIFYLLDMDHEVDSRSALLHALVFFGAPDNLGNPYSC